MTRTLSVAALVTMLVSAPGQVVEAATLGGGVCNDTGYEADGDLELEINLYSSALQELWSCRVLHQAINTTSSEKGQVFTVEYEAAGLYVGALRPGKGRLLASSSWKSCVMNDGPAQFTRLAPQPARPVSVSIAPACGFGFAVLDQIKQLRGYLSMTPSVDTILEETDEITGDSRELLVATTSFDQDATGQWWEYRMLVENGFEDDLDLHLDGPWARILGMPIELSLEAGSATDLLMRVPVGEASDEPLEYRELLEFDAGGDDYGAIPVSVVAPVGLGLRNRGDVDGDGALTISDGMAVANFLFASGEAPTCADAADFNSDEQIDLADVVALLHHLFLGSPGPAEPTADCSVVRDDVEFLITELGPSTAAPSQPEKLAK